MKRFLAHIRAWSKKPATTDDIILASVTTIVALIVGIMVVWGIAA